MGEGRYAQAGVSIDRANAFVEKITPLIRRTFKANVLDNFGSFASLYSLDITKYKQPVLVSSTDGVGTKLLVAKRMGIYDTVGIDLVAMCANDVLSLGATPLFFLDYLATGRLDVEVATKLVEGIAKGCEMAQCSLVGGENAELPGLYKEGDFDLAGFIVGVVEKEAIVDGSEISVGQHILGLSSSGLHSNGYSLARKVFFEELKWDVSTWVEEFGRTLGEELLEPTKIYVRPILGLLRFFKVYGIAHITGGGFLENIPRILPKGVKAVIKKGSWPVPSIFQALQEKGGISEYEMYRVFNNGIGMILVVSEEDSQEVIQRLTGLGESAHLIGTIEEREEGEAAVVITEV